jgi:hypothetical protein
MMKPLPAPLRDISLAFAVWTGVAASKVAYASDPSPQTAPELSPQSGLSAKKEADRQAYINQGEVSHQPVQAGEKPNHVNALGQFAIALRLKPMPGVLKLVHREIEETGLWADGLEIAAPLSVG